jgi:hypothetical protein
MDTHAPWRYAFIGRRSTAVTQSHQWVSRGGAPVARGARRGAVEDGRAERGRGRGGGGQGGEAICLAAVGEDLLVVAPHVGRGRGAEAVRRRGGGAAAGGEHEELAVAAGEVPGVAAVEAVVRGERVVDDQGPQQPARARARAREARQPARQRPRAGWSWPQGGSAARCGTLDSTLKHCSGPSAGTPCCGSKEAGLSGAEVVQAGRHPAGWLQAWCACALGVRQRAAQASGRSKRVHEW